MKKKLNRVLLYLQRIMSKEDKPNPVSSVRIAWYLQSQLSFDAVWHAYDPAPELPNVIDELWFVCSSWAYLDDAFRQRTLEIFPLANRVIWCNNDYNVPFHAYHLGRIKPRSKIFALATSRPIAERFGMSMTLDWNRLTYQPVSAPPIKDRLSRIYYFGSYRANRIRTFDQYLPAWGNLATVSAANGKDRKRFAERYPTIEVTDRSKNIADELTKYAATPILEDPYSHRTFVSPPNRFYEALSAGTAMFFEPEVTDIWKEYGYDVRPFIIPEDRRDIVTNAASVARRQRKWMRDFHSDLDADFTAAMTAINSGSEGIVGPPPGAKRYL